MAVPFFVLRQMIGMMGMQGSTHHTGFGSIGAAQRFLKAVDARLYVATRWFKKGESLRKFSFELRLLNRENKIQESEFSGEILDGRNP